METESNWIGEVLPVQIMNPEALATRTVEHEPEHFVCETFVLHSTDNPPYANISLDLARKGITILPIDNPVVVCHSQSQAKAPDNQTANVPFPQGAYVPAGTPLSVNGTGPLWITATVAGATRVSVVQTRRGSVA